VDAERKMDERQRKKGRKIDERRRKRKEDR
jgi:hypothetical protein